MAASALAAASSHGQSIWTNPITDANPSAANPFTAGQTVDPGITVSGIGRGAGIAANAGSNRYNANGWNSPSLDTTDYFTFTLTPTAGSEIDLVSFVYTGQASGSGAKSFSFRSSVDSFASDIGTPAATGATIDLSAASYQDLTAPIEFRLYGWGASGSGGTFSVNDFTFNGTVSTSGGPDTTPPTLVSTTPADGATNVSITTDLVLNFSETIVAATGNIELYETGNPTPLLDVPASSASIVGSVATFTLPAALELSTDYHVFLDAESFEDSAGNALVAGISDATVWNFKTASPPPAPPVLDGIADYTQDFSTFVSTETLPTGWSITHS